MKRIGAVLSVVFLCVGQPALSGDIEVDLELVLMVDVSRSMTERELEIQRRGSENA